MRLSLLSLLLKPAQLCLLGFGEVGQCFGVDLLAANIADIVAWDIKFAITESPPAQALQHIAVKAGKSGSDAAKAADIIISAVTAAQTVSAARKAAEGIKPGAFFLDMNSASPNMKKEAADIINSAGGYYVEAAVMSPIGPKRLATPILLGGPHATNFYPLAQDIGLTGTSVFSVEYGKASAAKMCRSIIVKGMESLLCESMLTARLYSVEDTVLTSLADLLPGPDWATLTPYMISRSIKHGSRRAEEMSEVEKTVTDVGLDPLMSVACAKRQKWAGTRIDDVAPTELHAMLDALIGTI